MINPRNVTVGFFGMLAVMGAVDMLRSRHLAQVIAGVEPRPATAVMRASVT
jgi:hypothetical protein